MKNINFILFLASCLSSCCFSCTNQAVEQPTEGVNVYEDVPFLQDYSLKYYFNQDGVDLKKIFSDRNGVVQVLSSNGLLKTRGGQFLHPGTLVPDGTYRTSVDKNISGIDLYKDQFVYVDDEAIFSHAWAGKMFDKHSLPNAHIVAGGGDFSFLISDGASIQFFEKSEMIWTVKQLTGGVIDIKYDPSSSTFWILGANALYTFSPANLRFTEVYATFNLNCFEIAKDGAEIIIGTSNGYLVVDAQSKEQLRRHQQNLPENNITSISEIDGNIWFGSIKGAFMLREDGKFNYYHGERWLPGSKVVLISSSSINSAITPKTKM